MTIHSFNLAYTEGLRAPSYSLNEGSAASPSVAPAGSKVAIAPAAHGVEDALRRFSGRSRLRGA